MGIPPLGTRIPSTLRSPSTIGPPLGPLMGPPLRLSWDLPWALGPSLGTPHRYNSYLIREHEMPACPRRTYDMSAACPFGYRTSEFKKNRVRRITPPALPY